MTDAIAAARAVIAARAPQLIVASDDEQTIEWVRDMLAGGGRRAYTFYGQTIYLYDATGYTDEQVRELADAHVDVERLREAGAEPTASAVEEAVRAWAKGIYPIEAGVELLIRSGRVLDGAPWIPKTGTMPGFRAWVDVKRLRAASGTWSGGERRLAAIAASLIDGSPVDLNDAIPGIDRASVVLVIQAISHASGWSRPDLEAMHGPFFAAP